ncbi:hypothetical protein LPN04_29415 [Rugamonas sp. A1-17]|nr:hypothetical protein [Rugamonas sp. A1-17]
MAHFLMDHWQVVTLVLLLVFGGSVSTEEVQEDDDWHAHPMNKEGMNWMGD